MKRITALLCLVVVGIHGCANPDAPAPRDPTPAAPAPEPNAAPVPASTVPNAAPVAPEKENVTVAVEYLINAIATSPLNFIRNDARHNGEDASKHIRSKYNYFQKDIKTAEDFIAKAATKSERSGKPYLVVLENGTRVELAGWLSSKLAEWRTARLQGR